MNEMIMEILHDSLPMLPFLFFTYVLMEYLEHKSSDTFQKHLQSAKKLGPLIGAILGIVPQCGFSVLASGLYMNRTISLGTLIAVFISTSDEAIPILVAHPEQINVLFQVVFIKLVIAIIVGYFVDALIRNNKLRQNHPLHDIHAECEKENEGHSSIAYIAFVHTMKIFLFIFIVNVVLSVGIYYIGEDTLGTLLASGSYLQPVLAAIVGFIPNCAASVMLAQLAMDGVISFGSLTAGLITSAGLGLLVLFKMYDNKKDILRILSILMVTAIVSGIILQFFG
ncbi:putative manganese transporter [Amedibacillus sp. YH-ame10]